MGVSKDCSTGGGLLERSWLSPLASPSINASSEEYSEMSLGIGLIRNSIDATVSFQGLKIEWVRKADGSFGGDDAAVKLTRKFDGVHSHREKWRCGDNRGLNRQLDS